MEEQEKEGAEIGAVSRGKEGETQEALPPATTLAQTEIEFKKLAEQLEEKVKEAAANYDKFLRACADLENYKKRVEREKGELISFSNERLIRELLPVIDNMERAIDHIEDEADLAAVKEGIKLVLDNLMAVLKKFGVEEVSAMGSKFDPAKHEAVSQEEVAECNPGTVIKEFHKCYYLNGRLLRPAMVVISKPPEAAPEMEEMPGGED